METVNLDHVENPARALGEQLLVTLLPLVVPNWTPDCSYVDVLICPEKK